MADRIKIIELEVAGWPDEMRDQYAMLVASGQSPVFAHMAVSRQAPRGNTDKAYLSRFGTLNQQAADDYTLGHITARAGRRGYKARPTDVYEPLAAAYPGDPAAFTNHGEGREKIARAKSRFAEPTKADPHEPVHKLHPEIVERNRKKMLEDDPGLKEKDQREIIEQIVDEHSLKLD